MHHTLPKLLSDQIRQKPGRQSFCAKVGLAVLLAAGTALAEEPSPALALAQQLNQAFIEVAEKVSPAVVVIEVAHRPDYVALDFDNPLLEMLPPEYRKQLEEELRERRKREAEREPRFSGQGSGVVIREDGYILTNSHVVEGAAKIRVRFKNGREYPAETRGVDPQSDLAVLKIDAGRLTTARLGDSAAARVGEFAIAIGAPFDLDYSVTFGHISGKGRSRVIPSWGANSLGASMDQDFIQTDASINPGNSGGPLVNIRGEVIGINALIRGMNTGIGFAIPSNLAKLVAHELITEGKYRRAWIGISIERLKESPMRQLVDGVEDGLIVRAIQPDGPAIRSELRAADIITAVDGQPVVSAQDLRSAVRAKPIGSELMLDVCRLGSGREVQKLKLTLKSAEWPERDFAQAARTDPPDNRAAGELGFTIGPLTAEAAKEHGVEAQSGVLVIEVEPDSPAFEHGIQTGDVITAVDSKLVTNPDDFTNAINRASFKKGILINLLSRGTPRFEILKDSGD